MPPRRFVVLFGVLLFVLIAMSPPQRVGDAREYLAMAMNLARLEPPALSQADMALAERRLTAAGFEGLPLAYHHQFTDASGRQDFFHFWFYPALAVPGIWLTSIAGLHPSYAFTALNVLLFLGALWVVSRRVAWWLTAVVFCSPALWWVDKSHTEAFTFSLLAMAFALLPEAPWWSLICLGAAATQNPPIALVLVCAAVATLAVRRGAWRDPRFLGGAASAGALALLHPVYYEWRWGLPTPQLAQGTHAHVPTIQELGAVLWDPNLGIVFHAPLLVLTLVIAAVIVFRRARSSLIEADVWLASAAAGILLVSFAQTTNLNSGATPGMSRYAIWLIPLSIPVVRRATAVLGSPAPRWFVLLALASCTWSLVTFQPRLPENYTAPTRTASALWAWWPSLDNPLPEVFAERVSGDEPGLVPIATPDCAKVLLWSGRWPVPCVPRPVPGPCVVRGALCYANRSGAGYDFVPVRAPAGSSLEPHRVWAWDVDSAPGIARVLDRVRWRALRRYRQNAPGAMTKASYGVSWTYGLQGDDDLVVIAAEPRQGASLTLLLPRTMSGSLIDSRTGDEIRPVHFEGRPHDPVSVELPVCRAVVLVLSADR